MRYILYHELQKYMTDYFHRHHKTLSFVAALERMGKIQLFHEGSLPVVDFSTCNLLNKEELTLYINQIAIPFDDQIVLLESSSSLLNPLIVFKYPAHSRAGIHIQDGIELNYVYSGSCSMYFEDNIYTLHENEVVIIPPGTYHDVYDTEDAMVFSCLIHQDYFNETFFQILRTDSVLSTFYDLSLYHYSKAFLTFEVHEPLGFLRTFLSMYSEFASNKAYNNDICINYIRILFAYLLRQPKWNFNHDIPSSVQQQINTMPAILYYIKCNYRIVSLNFLADFFHYDRSYLGKLIKKYTNSTFSELQTGYKLDHAVSLLINTPQSIDQIAEETGYQSADHFSRTFKKKYHMAPSKYRKLHQKQ